MNNAKPPSNIRESSLLTVESSLTVANKLLLHLAAPTMTRRAREGVCDMEERHCTTSGVAALSLA